MVYALPNKPKKYSMTINGQAVNSADFFDRKSPAHDAIVGIYPKATKAQTEDAIKAAKNAFDNGSWPSLKGSEKAKYLNKVAQMIRDRKEELALIEALESGKPVYQAEGEMEGSAGLWEYAASICYHTYGET